MGFLLAYQSSLLIIREVHIAAHASNNIFQPHTVFFDNGRSDCAGMADRAAEFFL